ncbi:MAG: hypothetical protein CL916_03950 [Deltaproteobacteria bacterium]|nr:hypothetical protein [Deltaproteobacteria bacterium]
MIQASIDHVAHTLLFGTSLKEKMWMPNQITKEKYHTPISIPDQPGRPTILSFGQGRIRFPTSQELRKPSKRAEALLFFANHELLAIELMSLFILRFPQTPWKLRRGLMNIIAEEQEHLHLYIERAKELGKEIGTVPVNRFFWDALHTMSSPEEFLSAMSLTFEQANLDHCIYYAQLFRQAGDEKSANIMDQIYADEIRHVRHGKHWSQQYGAKDMWEFHQENLKLPLTPARAKGKVFDESGRIKIGFSEEYIQSLRLYNSSRGRVPFVWECNPNIEHTLCHDGPQPKIVRKIQEALALLPIFLCVRDDILVVPTMPSPPLLEKIAGLGFPIPEISVGWKPISSRTIQGIIPWGKSPQHPVKESWRDIDKDHYSKSYGAQCLNDFIKHHPHPLLNPEEPIGISCSTIEEVEQAIERWSCPVVIKANLGASGRNTIRHLRKWEQGQKKWISRTLALQRCCVVEPILNRIIDFSMQIMIDDSMKVRHQGPIRQFTTQQGQYLGHWLGPVHKGLPKEMIRTLYQYDWKKMLANMSMFVGRRLAQEGHRGVIGVDCFLYQKDKQIFIRPIVEINPRYTMGHIAQAIRKRCSGPAIFSISRQNIMEESSITLHKSMCTQGHVRLNEDNAALGVFLTISQEMCAQWCMRHSISKAPI